MRCRISLNYLLNRLSADLSNFSRLHHLVYFGLLSRLDRLYFRIDINRLESARKAHIASSGPRFLVTRLAGERVIATTSGKVCAGVGPGRARPRREQTRRARATGRRLESVVG